MTKKDFDTEFWVNNFIERLYPFKDEDLNTYNFNKWGDEVKTPLNFLTMIRRNGLFVLAVSLTLILLGLYSCEKEEDFAQEIYRISALELEGDTIVIFTYNNNKLRFVDKPVANRTHSLFYDSANRLERISGGPELTFTYNQDYTFVFMYSNGNLVKKMELNEDGNPANRVLYAFNGEFLTLYDWEGDNLTRIIYLKNTVNLEYNAYSNPFYNIINNQLWNQVYFTLTNLYDFDLLVLSNKNCVSKITANSIDSKPIYEYDNSKKVITSITNEYDQTLVLHYELVNE